MKWFALDADKTVLGEFDTEAQARAAYRDELNKGWRICRAASVYRAPSRQHLEDHFAGIVRLVCAGTGNGYWDDHERIYRCEECFEETKDSSDESWCAAAGEEHIWHGHDVLREGAAA